LLARSKLLGVVRTYERITKWKVTGSLNVGLKRVSLLVNLSSSGCFVRKEAHRIDV